LCVNTLPATKVTLITDGIYFGSLSVNNVQPQLGRFMPISLEK
jgi:hypothetical protein